MYLLELPREGDSKYSQNVCFPEEYNENINKKNHDRLFFFFFFFADQIDVITKFAAITNVVIKRVRY